MRSVKNLAVLPSSFLADDILEFHAARILLLFDICGKGKIDGLTKMAKLDFFVRYPQFFRIVCNHLGKETKSPRSLVESRMVRYHYGPWDHRYYRVLAYLKARELIKLRKEGKKIVLLLTDEGERKALEFKKHKEFRSLIDQMRVVGEVLGKKSGTQLKNLIYKIFEAEVVELEIGEVIK